MLYESLVVVTFFAVVCFWGAQEGYAVLFSQKKVTKEKSRLGNTLFKLVLYQLWCYRVLRYAAF